MYHHVNFLICRESHWNGNIFNCRNIISIMPQNEGMNYDSQQETDPDWDNLLYYKKACSEEYAVSKRKELSALQKEGVLPDDLDIEKLIRKTHVPDCLMLKPEVMQWLNENVPDSPYDKSGKGWCIGSEAQRIRNPEGFTIWFVRRKDALNFVRTWSVYKKPTLYYNYLTVKSKKLNLKTGTLQPYNP